MKLLHSRRIALAIIILCFVSSCTMTPQPQGNPERQKTVDALTSLTAAYPLPAHFNDGSAKTRQPGDFDPNAYFTVLKHLSLQPGYALDFVYHSDGLGGYPIIYARPLDAPPFAEESEYTDWLFQNIGAVRNRGEVYFNYIQVDDTEESYFELALLYLQSGKFYLVWHANYYDYVVIADASGYQALKQEFNGKGGFGLELPAEVIEKANQLDFSPQVEMTDEEATVKLIYFTKWGGFIQANFTFSRPDGKLINATYETLIEYDCGIMF